MKKDTTLRLKFDVSQLVNEILDQLPESIFKSKTTTFFDPCIAGGQIVKEIERRLKNYGHSDTNISKRVHGMSTSSLRTNYAVNKNKLVGQYKITKDFLEENMNKKFDVVISNPPYTQGMKFLYRYFFEKSLELSNKVVMIMPYQPNSNYDSLKKLNKIIATHQEYISDNVSHHFNVGLDNIHYIIADKNIQNEVTEYKDPLVKYKELFPNRKRLNPILGNTESSDNKKTDNNGIHIIDKVNQNGEVTRKVSGDIVERAPQKVKTQFVVFTNRHPSRGNFNIIIKENYQSTWSLSVLAYEVDTKVEAEKLANWLKSDTIKEEVNKMLKLKKTYAVTLEMLKKLPWYE